MTEQHLSYPILHYYHSIRSRSATPRAVAMLDDVLLLLEAGVPEEHRSNEVLISTLESSIENYLEVLETEAIDPTAEPPPHPDLDGVRRGDVPTVTDEDFAEEIDHHQARRQMLYSAIRQTGRQWPSDVE